MSSILTNTSAMVALQTLNGINKGMAKVQSEISTGMKVANAKDNSSSWAIASTMRSDVSSFKKVAENLAGASAMVGVARIASEEVVRLMTEIKDKVVQGQDPSADTDKLQEDINAFSGQITSVIESAQFNGINLVGSTAAAVELVIGLNRQTDGSITDETLDVAAQDLTALGSDGTTSAYTAGTSTADEVETDLQTAIDAAAAFGSAQVRIDSQISFLNKLADSLDTGVGALVDADMEEASARLQALQVQQQLGVQALSIANQSPQSILSLFR